jgi:Na+-translocating ferredoxin:NAD+ oxidoreductase subunit A
MTDLLLLALGTVLVANHLLTESRGLCPLAGVAGRIEASTVYALGVLLLVAVAAAIAFAGARLFAGSAALDTLVPLALAALVVATALALAAWLRTRHPMRRDLLGALPWLAALGAAATLVALSRLTAGRPPLEALALALPAALVIGAAPAFATAIGERLAASNGPRAFRGLPQLLITAGLVALALTGYAGMLS